MNRRKKQYSLDDFQRYLFYAFALGAALGSITAAILLELFRFS